jgi:hypothetical protein
MVMREEWEFLYVFGRNPFSEFESWGIILQWAHSRRGLGRARQIIT